MNKQEFRKAFEKKWETYFKVDLKRARKNFPNKKLAVDKFIDEIMALIASHTVKEVEKARIDELENMSNWINKGLAETYRVRRIKELKALGGKDNG